jgi:hypothetical protein
MSDSFTACRDANLMQQLEAALAAEIEWRSVALKLKDDNSCWAAECDKLRQQPNSGATNKIDGKFLKLKGLVSKAIHPDGATDAREKQMRTVLFQQVWPKILEIEKGA